MRGERPEVSRRTLLLVRHAHAGPAEEGDDDRERALDERGREEARALARRLEAAGLLPERVLCSPARRALETLEPLRPRLPAAARVRTPELLYGASPGEILSLVQELDPATRCALVVGHNPSVAALARALAGHEDSGEPGAVARIGRFPPATLAVLVFAAPSAPSWADLAPGRGRLVGLAAPGDPPASVPGTSREDAGPGTT